MVKLPTPAQTASFWCCFISSSLALALAIPEGGQFQNGYLNPKQEPQQSTSRNKNSIKIDHVTRSASGFLLSGQRYRENDAKH
jgi:hypothetical protein